MANDFTSFLHFLQLYLRQNRLYESKINQFRRKASKFDVETNSINSHRSNEFSIFGGKKYKQTMFSLVDLTYWDLGLSSVKIMFTQFIGK